MDTLQARLYNWFIDSMQYFPFSKKNVFILSNLLSLFDFLDHQMKYAIFEDVSLFALEIFIMEIHIKIIFIVTVAFALCVYTCSAGKYIL